ncbi:GtrA family protein [Amnibacterium flavum]|uniref:GtrA family protein n=1 Tax=Amnibacterium flavum TaxID=2173173 RepID=A0A2V1HTE5_9MICO|nr:GtrA family protein [Amnibacterium flavum]PVZ95838.1 GtrA family protein [Amnibacterium flavum]
MSEHPEPFPTGAAVATEEAVPRGRLRTSAVALFDQLWKFALVGGVGFVIDFGVFNLLRATILAPSILHEGPILAKVASTTLAIVANWIGNRYWTFGPHRRSDSAVEAFEFVVVSLAGMGVGLLCLWVSHYVLGYTSLLADNISSNVIGLLLGSLLRFTLYRHWVYHPRRSASKR